MRPQGQDADRAEDRAFELWPENLPALELFIALQTQWRVSASMVGLIHHGIDYSAAEAVMRARRVRDRARLLEDLQVMEGAAMKELNRRD